MSPCVTRAGAIAIAVVAFSILAPACAPANPPPKVDGKSASEWIKLLAHADLAQREKARETLLQFDPPPVRELLASLPRTGANRKNVEYSQQDLDLLDGLSSVIHQIGERAVPALVELLDHKDDQLRAQATNSLGNLVMVGLDGGKHLPRYRKLLDDKFGPVRDAAVRVLGFVNDPQDNKPFVERLLKEDPDVAVQLAAAGASMLIEQSISGADPRMPPILRKSLSHEDDFVRMRAVQSLSEIGNLAAEALPDLERLFRDKNSSVRASAAITHMTISGNETALPVLMELLGADSAYAREMVASYLGGKKSRDAREALVKLAEADPARRVREAAAKAIKTIDAD